VTHFLRVAAFFDPFASWHIIRFLERLPLTTL